MLTSGQPQMYTAHREGCTSAPVAASFANPRQTPACTGPMGCFALVTSEKFFATLPPFWANIGLRKAARLKRKMAQVEPIMNAPNARYWPLRTRQVKNDLAHPQRLAPMQNTESA